jgi:type VI secretion system protein ImpG
MSESLYPYYESELTFIRKLAQEFARKYPAAAARLQLEPDRSADPHVERLIEAFALLAARVKHKLHDEFPELTDAMLSVIYPHALAPIPSMATVQFTVDPARGTPEGVKVPAGGMLHTARIGDTYCRYRTVYGLDLWPLAVAEAKLHPPPFPPGLNPPLAANAAIRLRLKCTGELPFDQLQFDTLRFHLWGENALTAPLYDLLFNQAIEVAFVNPEKPRSAVAFPASEVLLPVGFDAAEAMLSYPVNVFPGYRLLTEYFAYPSKFLYVDVAKFAAARPSLGPCKLIDVVVYLKKSHARLEQLLEPNMVRLGCTPVVNLFEQTAEPIQLTHRKPEYRVVPDVARPTSYEVYGIQQVTGASTDGTNREYQPFYRFQHGYDRRTANAFWYSTRVASLQHDDRGTDLNLHLVNTDFDPAEVDNETVVVRTLCSNRDLPLKLPRMGEDVFFEPAFSAPGIKAKGVRNPTGTLRPANPRGRYWHLVSHLNLNHLSLTDDAGGLDAFRGLLRLYDLNDPEAEPQAAALARLSIEGLIGVASQRTTAWHDGGFVRGIEVRLTFDETKFVANSVILFATLLERFLSLSVTVNSFTQTVAVLKQQDGELKRWPPRSGEKPLV